MQFTAQQIAQLVGGKVEGDPSVTAHKLGQIEKGQIGDLCFLGNSKYENYAYTTQASILLVSNDFVPKQTIFSTLIRVENVYSTMSLLSETVEAQRHEALQISVSKLASLGKNVQLGEKINIGEFTVIQENVVIGKNTYIEPHVFIGANTIIGDNCILYAGARIYANMFIGNNCIIHSGAIIGSDGFGFAPEKDGSYKKIHHVGNVLIEDDVEIGANTTIDRGSIGSTIIRRGVKLDNLIQIAHNVEVGENTVIAAQTGIAGSTKIGKNCRIGGQVGISGHLTIGDRTQIQAQSGVNRNTQADEKIYGSPAFTYNNYLRAYAVFRNLPDWARKLDQLWKEKQS